MLDQITLPVADKIILAVAQTVYGLLILAIAALLPRRRANT